MRRDAAVVALGALGQEIRLELVSLLARAGSEGLPAGAIAAQLGVPPASLSFHFQQLVRAGLLTQRRRSRYIIYSANLPMLVALLGYLSGRWECHLEEPEAPSRGRTQDFHNSSSIVGQ
jgi:ArsR family transcriptional regulator